MANRRTISYPVDQLDPQAGQQGIDIPNSAEGKKEGIPSSVKVDSLSGGDGVPSSAPEGSVMEPRQGTGKGKKVKRHADSGPEEETTTVTITKKLNAMLVADRELTMKARGLFVSKRSLLYDAYCYWVKHRSKSLYNEYKDRGYID